VKGLSKCLLSYFFPLFLPVGWFRDLCFKGFWCQVVNFSLLWENTWEK
jgi:hypothetical protein